VGLAIQLAQGRGSRPVGTDPEEVGPLGLKQFGCFVQARGNLPVVQRNADLRMLVVLRTQRKTPAIYRLTALRSKLCASSFLPYRRLNATFVSDLIYPAAGEIGHTSAIPLSSGPEGQVKVEAPSVALDVSGSGVKVAWSVFE